MNTVIIKMIIKYNDIKIKRILLIVNSLLFIIIKTIY